MDREFLHLAKLCYRLGLLGQLPTYGAGDTKNYPILSIVLSVVLVSFVLKKILAIAPTVAMALREPILELVCGAIHRCDAELS